MQKKHVAVLMGGWSSEREVSLSSGVKVVKALKELGYWVTPIDVTRSLPDLVQLLTDVKPNIVFNALHGVGGEDGVIQGVLEMMQIPYTHSGVTASAIAMNKVLSRQIFIQHEIPVPADKVISFDDLKAAHPMDFPYVIKPIGEGSSRGVSIIYTETDYQNALNNWTFGDQVLVEKYIPGREIQVSIINGKAVGAIELRVKDGYYDYDAKYTPGRAQHLMPAPLDAGALGTVSRLSEKAYHALGCRSVCRADFRYDDTAPDPTFYLLEMNTQPGMTPTSLVPETVGYYGMSFNQLVQLLIDTACCDGDIVSA
ncbi:D-alanine--D-alanine ligase [Candidatus Finniella inopinata]|uniref:D-alanine--D-alanine ligase n=1 Tax=Candidatus Finniella inopinata TaxID=1696036 RepID=A0A4Q7DIH4_9PROT|nr:D-alanine--D-alanine ligase [Candidatus Finniella inopinata]RZI45895.1 D-alanine--D-alanine ligase [Candidatus Finniella inopinata]